MNQQVVSALKKSLISWTLSWELKEDGVTVLFVEHDMEIVERYVSRVLAFYQGEIIADMPPKKALADKKVQEFVIGKEHHKKKK